MFSTQTAQTQRRDQPATRPQPTQVERSGGLDDDRALLQAMLADDEDAWREFNTRYSRLIYRCITRVTARFSAVVGPDDVREIYGMVCMGLLANDKRKLRSFEPGRGNKLGSWIGMLAIHTAYDFLRGVKREPKRGCLTEAEALSSELPDPYEVVRHAPARRHRDLAARALQRQGP